MIGLWPIYKTIAKLDLAKMGLIAGLCAFIGEGMQIVFGALSDRGYRKVLILFGCLSSTTGAFLAYTENYFYLFLLFVFVCIGSGAYHPSAVSLVGGLSKNRKGLLISIFASGGALGLASSQLIFSYSYAFFEGSTVFLVVPTLALVVWMGFYQMKNAENQNKIAGKKVDLKAFFGLFKNRNISLLYFTQLCSQTVAWAIIFLLPDVLLSRGHVEWVTFGGGHLFFILGGAAMMIPSGYLADKYSFKSVLFFATFFGMLAFYAFLFVPYISTTAVISLLFVMGMTIQVVNPIITAYGNRLLPENPGLVSSFLMGFVWCVSEGLGQGGGGLLTKLFDESDAPANALAVLGTLFFVSLGLISLLPSPADEKEASLSTVKIE